MKRTCFPRLLMGGQEALLIPLSLPIHWETLRLPPSGSPSFTLQFENHWPHASNAHHWQMFQLGKQHRRQGCLMTVASRRDFTCCPSDGKVLRFYLGFLTAVMQRCLFIPFSTAPSSHCLSCTSVGKSSLSRPQPVFAGGPWFLPVGLAMSFMPAA